MSVYKRLSQVYHSADIIPFDQNSRIVLMSDCHRGDGNWNDNFAHNQNLFFAALNYYYEQNFIYIELGDGDELWENRDINQIITMHSDAYWLMSQFYQEGRFHMLFGNHDMEKKFYGPDKLASYYNESEKRRVPLFPDIKIREGLILEQKENGNRILLAHGHQGDFLNDRIWRIARILVRYLWSPLELVGFNDPTSAAQNYDRKETVEGTLAKWSKNNHTMLISGHTHRPVFPRPGEHLYFNDGSCIHPRCITAIEIVNGSITLVKWSIKTRHDRTLLVDREILAGPESIDHYFQDEK